MSLPGLVMPVPTEGSKDLASFCFSALLSSACGLYLKPSALIVSLQQVQVSYVDGNIYRGTKRNFSLWISPCFKSGTLPTPQKKPFPEILRRPPIMPSWPKFYHIPIFKSVLSQGNGSTMTGVEHIFSVVAELPLSDKNWFGVRKSQVLCCY